MGLIIALDDNEEAVGELFWDDGESTGEPSPTAFAQQRCQPKYLYLQI